MQLRSSLILSFAAIPLTALADPLPAPSPKAPSPAETVQVQPRGNEFMPNSVAEDALQKRITDFNRKLEGLDADLDKKLKICRGC
ncbi:hypothetical protein ABIB94_003083 [Bradyrhizobium sp. JR7.2]|jgi:hypothetical protein|uniref:Uncharacterized protein n=4 Tax=Bradyrhizobium TaxID=374 RepID=A0A1L3FQM7_BRAJP|nr:MULTISPECIES: hypothetical protein [Bradyrhizobium]APG15654.1 hypothetical protein BKD09_45965 [Bradyrhizobium japonicum]MCK1281997.1 hypothetical protein [Bradyrhizobium sp. 61]MCK1448947.1 hypothetical protein [Bradyrhizobium sp. 48]MCK1457520.1 hypothetical protein [Bradyrhizobium sp. 2]MCS3933669.1 hypothetical protein [Bradyrhizobium elkanii]